MRVRKNSKRRNADNRVETVGKRREEQREPGLRCCFHVHNYFTNTYVSASPAPAEPAPGARRQSRTGFGNPSQPFPLSSSFRRRCPGSGRARGILLTARGFTPTHTAPRAVQSNKRVSQTTDRIL